MGEWGYIYTYPTLRRNVGKCSDSRSSRLTPDCLGLRSGLHAVANRKVLCFNRESNLGRPTRSMSLYWLSDRALFKTWIWHENLRIIVWDSCIPLHGFQQPTFCTVYSYYGHTRFDAWCWRHQWPV